MNGLLEKDFRLTLQKKQLFVVYILMGIVLAFNLDDSWIVSFFTMLGSMLGISTLSYDEYENGYTFLFTLPITRKIFALEKYLFGILITSCFWITAIIIQIGTFLFRHKSYTAELVFTDLVFLFLFLFIFAMLLPFFLKYGPEKARFVMFAFFGTILALITLGSKILSPEGASITESLSFLDQIPDILLIIPAVVIYIALYILSIRISIRIVEKKEF